MRTIKKQMMLVTLGCLVLWMTTAAVASEHHEHMLKVGKKGEITLKEPAKVGNTVLQPDTYIVQHRTSGGNHFVRFIELKTVADWTEGSTTYKEEDKAGEIKCRIEPATAPIKETMVYMTTQNGENRITKVAIKGEDVVHIF